MPKKRLTQVINKNDEIFGIKEVVDNKMYYSIQKNDRVKL